METLICKTAIIDDGAIIGNKTHIWNFAHVCGSARIGDNCNIGQNVYIDHGATIGNNCKLQNNVNVYYGVTLEDFVFCGPSMTFTNVKAPRCKYPRKKDGAYYINTLVKEGATLGAHSVIVCGVVIGKNAMVGSGAVVTHDVPAYALVVGNPAVQIGWVCECGCSLQANLKCKDCGKAYQIYDNKNIEEIHS